MKHVVVGILSKVNKKAQKEYLLIKPVKNFGRFTGFYYPPGGHLEEKEDEKDALTREIKEELNLTVVPVKKIAETPGDIKGQTTHWWQCKVVEGQLKLDKSEIAEAKFFSKAEMEKINIWPATKAFFADHIFM